MSDINVPKEIDKIIWTLSDALEALVNLKAVLVAESPEEEES